MKQCEQNLQRVKEPILNSQEMSSGSGSPQRKYFAENLLTLAQL